MKKLYLVFKYYDITLNNKIDDLMIEAYILNYPLKDDISYLMNVCGFDAMACEDILKKKAKLGLKLKPNMISKAKFIYDNRVKFYEELKKQNSLDLYEKMDLPLTYVLIDMEYTGVRIDKEFLLKMKEEVFSKVTEIENQIYFLAGTRDFNIMSPKQLGKVLFEDLEIPYPKKVKNDKYSTSVDILNKLTDYEIVRKILEYRTLTKLYSNYIVGLIDYIKEDGRIHTIFNQTLTRTGRLSSTSPNLQNIPIREEYGKLIRKAFIASP